MGRWKGVEGGGSGAVCFAASALVSGESFAVGGKVIVAEVAFESVFLDEGKLGAEELSEGGEAEVFDGLNVFFVRVFEGVQQMEFLRSKQLEFAVDFVQDGMGDDTGGGHGRRGRGGGGGSGGFGFGLYKEFLETRGEAVDDVNGDFDFVGGVFGVMDKDQNLVAVDIDLKVLLGRDARVLRQKDAVSVVLIDVPNELFNLRRIHIVLIILVFEDDVMGDMAAFEEDVAGGALGAAVEDFGGGEHGIEDADEVVLFHVAAVGDIFVLVEEGVEVGLEGFLGGFGGVGGFLEVMDVLGESGLGGGEVLDEGLLDGVDGEVELGFEFTNEELEGVGLQGVLDLFGLGVDVCLQIHQLAPYKGLERGRDGMDFVEELFVLLGGGVMGVLGGRRLVELFDEFVGEEAGLFELEFGMGLVEIPDSLTRDGQSVRGRGW